MSLIDADDFMEYLGFDNTDEEREENVGQIVTLEDFDRQETAYDVDKVIKSINEIGQRYCNSVKCGKNCKDCEHGCLMRAIINAVKSGGVTND